ncbi:MAG: hypothetical protein ABIP55_10570 [Tepidisphaeraceae bacterium]
MPALVCCWIALLVAPALLRSADAPAVIAPVTETPAVAAPVADAPAAAKAPPERTYSNAPFVHRIVLLDEDGTTIRAPKPGEEANTKPFSMAKTCGKCHSDYNTMEHGWHFNFSDAGAAHGRPGEPWILTDAQTRTQLPLSYRRWKGTFYPHDVGINDFNFARLFGRHHTGGGALAASQDLRFKMSGAMEIDCLICHTADSSYDAVARAKAFETDQNFKYAASSAASLGTVQGSAAKLRDNFDPTGPDARRAPKVNYDAARFDNLSQVLFDLTRRVPNDRCYFCHTSVDAGRVGGEGRREENSVLESRFRHDGDIHLAKGMSCVDCHQHGADHMVARGYEGEYDDRVTAQGAEKSDKTITTLSCSGCHNGTGSLAGGRNAAPRPVHRGLPTLHFDKLSCTACHSGPSPSQQATLVQTAMAHKLGLPRHHTADAAAPTIQQTVFLRDDKTGKLTPYRVLYPSYWGRRGTDGTITPISPEHVVAAGTDSILGPKSDAKKFEPFGPLSEDQISQVLDKLKMAKPPPFRAPDVVTARAPITAAPTTTITTTTAPTTTTTATTQPAAPTGEPVYVTGGKVYRQSADGKLESSDLPTEDARYAWPLAHDVRPAQQSLGSRGCVECHVGGAPIFDGTATSAAVLTGAAVTTPMHELRGESIGALRVFAWTYPLRWLLIVIGYASAGVLLLVLLAYATRGVFVIARRRAGTVD